MICKQSASFTAPFLLLLSLTAGCGNNGVSSEEKAKQAYEGLDASIDKAIALGFDGFNAASSANIPPQSTDGEKAGKMTIGGKVDQGSSSNKTMNLDETLVGYRDDEKHTYDTDPAALPLLSMKLSKVPNGTVSGTLAGKFKLTGEIQGTVTLQLSFNGDLQPGAGGMGVERKPGTTHITGSADSEFGTYDVDVTR